jgi:hypothetical protein
MSKGRRGARESRRRGARALFKKELEPRLEEAQKGQRDLYFVDAAHFVLAAFLGRLWSFARIFIPSPSGRQRFNVLGALHATTHKLITECNVGYINGLSVCALLDKIAAVATLPITIILDNAAYQRCALVRDKAMSLGIELLFLPPYSPNLNLIERLWKFVKKEALYSRYYPTFVLFKAAISNVLDNTHATHKEALDSLLVPKFQLFDKRQIQTLHAV